MARGRQLATPSSINTKTTTKEKATIQERQLRHSEQFLRVILLILSLR